MYPMDSESKQARHSQGYDELFDPAPSSSGYTLAALRWFTDFRGRRRYF